MNKYNQNKEKKKSWFIVTMGKSNKSGQKFHFEVPFMGLEEWNTYLSHIVKAFEEQTLREIAVVFAANNALFTFGKLGEKISCPFRYQGREKKNKKKKNKKKKQGKELKRKTDTKSRS